MVASGSRWAFLPLVGALLAVGVASIAFAMGVASGGSPISHAAPPTTIPGHPGLGPGRLAPSTVPGTTAPPSVQGTVASKTATTMVVTTAAGKTATVDVSSATRYTVRGVSAPGIADIAVGDRIVAQGTLNADGSLNATTVKTVPNGQPGFGGSGGRGSGGGGRGFGGGRGPGGGVPLPTPLPSGATSGSST